MKGKAEPGDFDSLDPKRRQRLQELVPTLLDTPLGEAAPVLAELMECLKPKRGRTLTEKSVREAAAVVLQQLILILSGAQSTHRSPLYEYLSLLNQLPLPRYSDWEKTLNTLLACDPHYSDAYESQFRRLEVMYLLTSLGDYDTAESFLPEFEGEVNPQCLKLNIIYQFALSHILQHQREHEQLLRLWLELVHQVYLEEGAQVALYIVIKWIIMLNWDSDAILKRELLFSLDQALKTQKNLCSAAVLFELFSLEDKLVSLEQKMQYVSRLIKHPVSLLTYTQLQLIYFFAGNYSSGMQLQFSESLQYFKYSNYFLHKRWGYIFNLSQFLREHLNVYEYLGVLPSLEALVQMLGSQVSLQNNAYVETLQADYDKIDKLFKQVEMLSETDALTGLKNRRHLETTVQQMFLLAVRHKVEVCFAMIDIDHFKLVNDNLGHQAGDFVLRELADLISRDFRKSDVILRYGGEEFLILLFDSNLATTRKFMEELRIDIEGHYFEFQGNAIPITVSIGISCFHQDRTDGNDVSRMIALADKAMYRAKNAGRNQVLAYRE